MLLFAAGQMVFFSRVNTPYVPLFVGETKRFFVLPHTVFAVLLGLGAGYAMELAGNRARWGEVIVGALLAIGIAIGWSGKARTIDMSGNIFTRDLGYNALYGMPVGALAMVNGDLFRNAVQYQQVCLLNRPDVDVVLPNMMGARWYLSQLRRRGGIKLADTMTVYTGAQGTNVWSWFNLNGGGESQGRPMTVIGGLPDDSWERDYRMRDMGIWSQVVRRHTSPKQNLAGWTDEYADVVSKWRVAALDTAYDQMSWEASESIMYRYALGHLQAACDIGAEFGRGRVRRVPALAIASRWRGSWRADFLSYQADLWMSCWVDSLAGSSAEERLKIAERAVRLAREGLRFDTFNVQALQVLAWSYGSVREIADLDSEVYVRHRIVALRPGSPEEMIPYCRSVGRLVHGARHWDPRILEVAEADRRQFSQVLSLAVQICPDVDLARFRDHWSSPFSGPDDPRFLGGLALP
jgi:hypothetical protein